MDIDPYKVLGVSKNFTADELKSAYKKLALAMHPDKQGGNEYMFKLITQCYKTLVKEYNKKISDKHFYQLKQEAKKQVPQHVDPKKSFNLDKFNSVFEQNKISDASDVGYNEWLKAGDDPNQPKYKGKFTLNSFNKQFETQNKVQTNHIIKYVEPEPMSITKKIQYTELGMDNTDDFSGENLSKKTLNYMDVKLAHTTSRIIDPSTVQRKEYKGIDDIKVDRENVQLTDAELRAYAKQKALREMKEKERLQNLQKYDEMTAEHFNRVNRLMLNRS